MTKIALALDALFTRYLNLMKSETGNLPRAPFDPPWPSPCLQDTLEDSNFWRPTQRQDTAVFESLEAAFDMTFRPEISEFYGTFWANGISVVHDDLHLNLIQVWNEEDQEQLKENMLGHLFAKQKNKLPLSYFIGCTDGDEVISLSHATGEIVLERPGQKPHRTLAPTLESFLLALHPLADSE